MTFHNEFKHSIPSSSSYLLIFYNQNVLIASDYSNSFSCFHFPQYADIHPENEDPIYLFSIDTYEYFLLTLDEHAISHVLDHIIDNGFDLMPVRDVRNKLSKQEAFIIATAFQLYQWYQDNRFCGRCSHSLKRDTKERMLLCPSCHNMIYPKISPAIVVGIIDKDRILLSRYAHRSYSKYALIAGFNEIGETIEQTVCREVMEEVGLKVKNITYYKSQPWAASSSLLIGFFAELDGDNQIILDENELEEAGWFSRGEIPELENYSLTNEMMYVFASGKDPFHI